MILSQASRVAMALPQACAGDVEAAYLSRFRISFNTAPLSSLTPVHHGTHASRCIQSDYLSACGLSIAIAVAWHEEFPSLL